MKWHIVHTELRHLNENAHFNSVKLLEMVHKSILIVVIFITFKQL